MGAMFTKDAEKEGERTVAKMKAKSKRKNSAEELIKLRDKRAKVREKTSNLSRKWTDGKKDYFKPTKRRVLLSLLLIAGLVAIAAGTTAEFFALP